MEYHFSPPFCPYIHTRTNTPSSHPGSILSAPGNFGNAAGDTIQGTLGKVGNPVGKGLETVAKPVGGLVEPIVGGLFKAPENFAHATDASKDVETHNDDLAKPIAGEEQTASNPLGLNQK